MLVFSKFWIPSLYIMLKQGLLGMLLIFTEPNIIVVFND